jgi:hypothetical protein
LVYFSDFSLNGPRDWRNDGNFGQFNWQSRQNSNLIDPNTGLEHSTTPPVEQNERVSSVTCSVGFLEQTVCPYSTTQNGAGIKLAPSRIETLQSQ